LSRTLSLADFFCNGTSTVTSKVPICIALYNEQLTASPLRRSGMARVNDGSHSFAIPAYRPTLQPQGITAIWLVLILPSHGRLSRPRWLVTYRNKVPSPRESNPDTVTHPITNRAQRRLTSLIKTKRYHYAKPPSSVVNRSTVASSSHSATTVVYNTWV